MSRQVVFLIIFLLLLLLLPSSALARPWTKLAPSGEQNIHEYYFCAGRDGKTHHKTYTVEWFIFRFPGSEYRPEVIYSPCGENCQQAAQDARSVLIVPLTYYTRPSSVSYPVTYALFAGKQRSAYLSNRGRPLIALNHDQCQILTHPSASVATAVTVDCQFQYPTERLARHCFFYQEEKVGDKKVTVYYLACSAGADQKSYQALLRVKKIPRSHSCTFDSGFTCNPLSERSNFHLAFIRTTVNAHQRIGGALPPIFMHKSSHSRE